MSARPFKMPTYRTYTDGARGSREQWQGAFHARLGPDKAREVLASDDPHVVLGIRKGASAQEIKSAYRRMAREHHPDFGGSDAAFIKVQAAYEVLS